ncbi:uncharacterized protein LOC135821242 [Sycon ciliatum]|uniref:uncharacterized protein LOC135821242 n=1 Tax=Sycon ciliatum TaxID=27933 RepID=UPI0020AD733B|eukprot:scpid45435/ scgid10168/ Proton-coupled amino acid transporter 1; Solute carrier family 36 member 1
MHDADGTTSSVAKIFANVFISFVGAGVLGLPYAFKEAGIVEGSLVMVMIAIISSKAMLLIIDCKDFVQAKRGPDEVTIPLVPLADSKVDATDDAVQSVDSPRPVRPKITSAMDYGDVGYHAMGTNGRILVDISIVVSQTGFCCAYLIFISQNMAQMFKTYVPIHENGYLAILLAPLAGLALLRTLGSLAIFSAFADFANILAYTIVFWFDFEHLNEIPFRPRIASASSFPFFLSVAIFCYEGAGMILSLESSVSLEVRHKFKPIFLMAMAVITTLYVGFGVCGYMTFGPHTKNIVTLNLPEGFLPVLVKSCLCFSLLFTYPVMMFPVIRIIESQFSQENMEQWKSVLLRFCMVILTILIVLIIPDFSVMIALIGSTCCTLLAFILPAIFHIRIFGGKLTRWQMSLDYFLIVVGFVGGSLGLRDALTRL